MDAGFVEGAWEERGERLTRFLRDLLALESPPGGEDACARRVEREMRELGLERVRIDDWGNVLAEAGPSGGPGLLLNAHIDIVGAGDSSAWRQPPFGGDLVGGTIYGRGACDTKAAVAAQVYAAALLAERGRLASRVTVAAVVMEEIGGVGTLGYLQDHEAPEAALVGEPSDGCLMVGHRGRVQIEVDLVGRAHHAAVAGAGVSPHPSLARLLEAVRRLDLPVDGFYGAGTCEPTIVRSDNDSPNVVPERVHVVLDCRTIPGQDEEALLKAVRRAAEAACTEGVRAQVRVPRVRWRTWTGRERELPHVMPSFGTNREDPIVAACLDSLESVLGEAVEVRPWKFATDGGHLTAAGSTVVGWGPGRQERAHTVDEHITLEELRAGFEGTLACVIALDRGLRG